MRGDGNRVVLPVIMLWLATSGAGTVLAGGAPTGCGSGRVYPVAACAFELSSDTIYYEGWAWGSGASFVAVQVWIDGEPVSGCQRTDVDTDLATYAHCAGAYIADVAPGTTISCRTVGTGVGGYECSSVPITD